MRVHPLQLVLSSFLYSAGACSLAAQQVTDAQGDIGIGTFRPHPSAIVEMASVTKGMLLPRMSTAQRNAIRTPADGLLVFNTTLGEFQFWNAPGGRWETLLTTGPTVDDVPASEGRAWSLDGNSGSAPWNGATGNFVGQSDNAPLVLKTEEAGIEFWTENTRRATFDTAGNLQPGADERYSLGTDEDRWRTAYLNGTNFHIGPAGGEADGTELAVGYAAGTGLIDVDGGGAEIAVTTGRTTISTDLLLRGNLIVKDEHLHSVQENRPISQVAGPNVASVSLGNATDIAGLLTITTGSAPLHGTQARVIFNIPYGVPPVVTLTPADDIAAGVGPYVTRTNTGFSVGFMGLPAASTSYHFFYQVIETE